MWLCALALADVLPEDRRLEGADLAVGVGADGSLVNGAVFLGARWDPDGAEGPEPLGGDLWFVGRPFEGWAVEAGGETLSGAEDRGAVALTWEGDAGAAGALLVGAASGESFDVALRIEAWTATPVVWIDVGVSARADLDAVTVTRVVDPDPDAWLTGSYAVELLGATDAVAATGVETGRTVALAALDGQAGSCAWCVDAASLAAGGLPTGSVDSQVGVWVELGPLVAGEVAHARFAYAFGTDPAAALALAQEAAADVDHDDDGAAADDCDDLEPAAHPGADELPNGRDDDCDGVVDDGFDADRDGYSTADGDCDDADPAAHPGATPGTTAADLDCDGYPDDGSWTGELPPDVWGEAAPEGGCATISAPRGAWSLVALLALRRRRCS